MKGYFILIVDLFHLMDGTTIILLSFCYIVDCIANVYLQIWIIPVVELDMISIYIIYVFIDF